MVTVAPVRDWDASLTRTESAWTRPRPLNPAVRESWVYDQGNVAVRWFKLLRTFVESDSMLQELGVLKSSDPNPGFFSTVTSILALHDTRDSQEWSDFVAPSPDSTIHALVWVNKLRQLLLHSNSRWIDPLVSDSADGGVMLEWWNHDTGRKLTVYIHGDRSEYVQVWGTDIFDEMDEGNAEPLESFASVWWWLTK